MSSEAVGQQWQQEQPAAQPATTPSQGARGGGGFNPGSTARRPAGL